MAFTPNLTVLVCLLVVCCGRSPATATNPGFKARVTQSGLDYFRDVGVEILRDEINDLQIPGFSQRTGSFIGDVTYTISNIRITNFAVPSPSLTTRDGLGMVLQGSGLGLQITADWHYTNHGWIRIRDSGRLTGGFSGATLGVTMRIGKNSAGRLTVSSFDRDCSFDAGDVRIRLSGGASWLYNLFNLARFVKPSLNRETCSAINRLINRDLQNRFDQLSLVSNIDNVASIDYRLMEPPEFSTHVETTYHKRCSANRQLIKRDYQDRFDEMGPMPMIDYVDYNDYRLVDYNDCWVEEIPKYSRYVDMNLKGEVFPRRGARMRAPFTAPVIPPDSDTSRHVFLWLTDYLFETAGYVYYRSGVISTRVTRDMLSAGLRCTRDTSSLCEFIQAFPNIPLEIDARMAAPPTLDISSARVKVSLKFDNDFFAIFPNGSRDFLFTLTLTASGSAVLSTSANKLKWNFSSVTPEVNIKQSAIGTFDVGLLQVLIDNGSRLLLDQLNAEGETGIPLPVSPNIQLVDTVLTQGEGFIKLGANIVFTP